MEKIDTLFIALFSFLPFSCNEKPNVVEDVTSYTLVSKINCATLGYGINEREYSYLK